MQKLGAGALRVWQFVTWYIDTRGYAPTVREVAAGLGISNARVDQHLIRLEERGLIELLFDETGRRRARALRVVERPPTR